MLAAAVGLGAGEASALPGKHVWSQSFGDTAQQWLEDVAVDAAGDTVVVGQYGGTFDLGGGALPPGNYYYNLYLTKRDGAGAHVWSRGIRGVSDDDFGFVRYERRLAVDTAGNILIAGNYYGAPDFGCGPLAQATGSVFVVKLDGAGRCVWSRGFPGAHVESPRIAVDGTGRVAVTGFFSGSLDFGGGPLASAQGLFLAKLSATGTHLWSKRFEATEGTLAPGALGVASDAAGNTFLTGGFSGFLNLGGGSAMRSRGGQDLFIGRFNQTGGLNWGRRFGDALDQVGHGLAVDSAGNIVLTGGFGGALAVDTVLVTAQSASDAFVVKLDVTGHGLWARQFTDASGTQHGTQVAVDAAGNIATSGHFTGYVDLGAGPLDLEGDFKRYVARLDGAGTLLWGLGFVNEGFDFDTRVAVDAAGDVRVGGSYTGTAWFYGDLFTAQGGSGAYDVFVARYRDY